MMLGIWMRMVEQGGRVQMQRCWVVEKKIVKLMH
jgi:hypothetical protein